MLDDEWSEVLDHEIELNTDLLARICVALNSAHRTGRTPSSAMLVGVCRWLQRPAMPKAQMLKGLPPGSDTRVREKVSRISREGSADGDVLALVCAMFAPSVAEAPAAACVV